MLTARRRPKGRRRRGGWAAGPCAGCQFYGGGRKGIRLMDGVAGRYGGLWGAVPCGGASLRVGHWSWADKVCCQAGKPVCNLQERG